MRLVTYRFDKLIRDKLLDVMRTKGVEVASKSLSGEEYEEYLGKKLMEEAAEVNRAQHQEELVEELADVLEVVHAILKHHGFSLEEIEAERQKKYQAKGGFSAESYVEKVTLGSDHPLAAYYQARPLQYPQEF